MSLGTSRWVVGIRRTQAWLSCARATTRLAVVAAVCHGCVSAPAGSLLPEWTRIPAQPRGSQWVFSGQGQGATEAEARASALRVAREEAARVRRVRVESELQASAGEISMTGRRDSASLSWERVVQGTRERADAVLTRALPYGEALVVRRGRIFVVWARVAIDETDLFPWIILARALDPTASSDSEVARLVAAARQLESRGEAPLAELALRRAAAAADSTGAMAAAVEFAWFLQRQGREVEALRWLQSNGGSTRFAGELRESANRLLSMLATEPRGFDRYTEDLVRLVRPFLSDARMRLRPMPRAGRPTGAPGTAADVDFLLDMRDREREVAVVWIDSNGVRLEVPSAGRPVARGIQTLTLSGTRGVGQVTVVVVGAESVAPLGRLLATGQPTIVHRWMGDGTVSDEQREGLAYRGLLEAVGSVLRQSRAAATAIVHFVME